MTQLVEWSLPIPEIRGSNPVIGKNLYIYIRHERDISRGIISRQKSGRVEIEIGEASPTF